jgi:hypothetical protein
MQVRNPGGIYFKLGLVFESHNSLRFIVDCGAHILNRKDDDSRQNLGFFQILQDDDFT